MNHESKLAAELAKADAAHEHAATKADADRDAQVADLAAELQKYLDFHDGSVAGAEHAREAALDAARATWTEAVSIANRKFDDAMRAELGLNLEIREQGGVLFLVDPKTQLTVATCTPVHGGHARVNGPRGDITIVSRDRGRAALWESAKPVPVPAPA